MCWVYLAGRVSRNFKFSNKLIYVLGQTRSSFITNPEDMPQDIDKDANNKQIGHKCG